MILIIGIVLVILAYILIGPKDNKDNKNNKVQKKSREDKFFDFVSKHVKEDNMESCSLNEGIADKSLKFIHYNTETLSLNFFIKGFYGYFNTSKVAKTLTFLFEELDVDDADCTIKIVGTDVVETISCNSRVTFLLDEVGRRVLGKTFTSIRTKKIKEREEYRKQRQDATKKFWEQIEKGE